MVFLENLENQVGQPGRTCTTLIEGELLTAAWLGFGLKPGPLVHLTHPSLSLSRLHHLFKHSHIKPSGIGFFFLKCVLTSFQGNSSPINATDSPLCMHMLFEIQPASQPCTFKGKMADRRRKKALSLSHEKG